MTKKEYKFNPRTLTYDVITMPFRARFYRIVRGAIVAFLFASVVNFLFSYFFYTPKMYRINKENNELVIKYSLMQERLRAAQKTLSEIAQRDNHVYRSLFAVDTLGVEGIYTPYPESKYARMERDHFASLMIGTWSQMDDFARKLYLRSVSLDQLQTMSMDKEQMAASVPAIWPINKKLLRGNIGRFGGRSPPTLHVWKMHEGIDLGGRIGDPVYATGDGVVKSVSTMNGYGKQVLIDHGFGYQTRYAHLSKQIVEPGQHVKRGEQIAMVGNTGRSSGPHLHYEVIYMGHPVNPINYFRLDMSQQELDEIIASATATTYETD